MDAISEIYPFPIQRFNMQWSVGLGIDEIGGGQYCLNKNLSTFIHRWQKWKVRKEIFSQIMKRKFFRSGQCVGGEACVWYECQWCGKEFTPLKSWQKYCSPACRVAANRKRLPKDEVHTQEAVLIRSFRCLQCGEVVNVYDPSDNRFKFCCVHCEKLYWKHPEKKREKGIRQFQCHACGKNVIVTDPLDRRRFYCSETCREAQHRAKQKVIREQKKKG